MIFIDEPIIPHSIKCFRNISENTLTSSGRLQSKDLYISCSIDRSWYSQESEGLNQDWLGQSKLFSPRYSKIELKITLSKNFSKNG